MKCTHTGVCVCVCVFVCVCVIVCVQRDMVNDIWGGYDRSLLQKSPIQETHILQKRPAFLKSQLIIATP